MYLFPELFLGRLTNERIDYLKEIAGDKIVMTGGVRYHNGLRNSKRS